MAAELTAAEYAYLIILQAEGREISNTEMFEFYEVRLRKPDYEKLNADGYVISTTKRSPYRHVITDRGSKVLGEALTIDQGRVAGGAKRSAGERQLFWAAMVAQHKLLLAKGNGTSAVIEKPLDLDSRIRAAYTKLAGAPGDYVNLTELRPLIGDIAKAEVDRALVRLLDSPDVRLEPEPFGHRIGAEERKAAVHIGGEDRHKLAIGLR
ncbi:hypothetical protein AB0C29_19205 [Actinoplanes sp. NPDC048791]|uniref:hypothetical protein n=1 Tax=Actinoplanes sp. NPDC048791 TaxID=3154623 RepID=UPI0033D25ABA